MRDLLQRWLWCPPRTRRRSRWQITAVEVGLWSTERLEDRALLSNDPVFDVPGYSFNLGENTPAGVIGNVTATDADGQTVTYSGGAGPFSVDPQSGEISFVGSLDYEAQNTFSFLVTATDPDNNTGTATVEILILDVDDERPVFDSAYSIPEYIAEDAQPGYSVSLLFADDPDTPPSGVTYSIVPPDEPGEPPLPFDIEPGGLLTTSGDLDYETRSTYQFTILATDTADNEGEMTMTVYITDVNPYPEFGPSSYEFSVPEDAEPDTPTAVVGQVHATDPEGEPLTYLLDLGPDIQGPIQFEIDAEGWIRVASSLDYESIPSYPLVAYARDPASQTAEVDVMVIVTDVDEVPYASDDYFSTVYNTYLEDPAPGVMGNDQKGDSSFLTATLDAGPSSGTLDYFNSDGSFRYTPNPGFTGTDSFTYHINDGMEDSNVATVTIDVNDVTLHWVTFEDEHEISSDPPATGSATLYDQKHWLDEDLDGDATGQSDRLWPVAYTRNTVMKVSAELVLDNAWSGGEIRVKADGPGNLDIHPTVANVTGEKITITAVAAANAFPNSVEHYDNFDLAWQLSTDGGFTWINVGTSSNDLYLTLNDPSITTLYHTVVDIGSHNADGEDTELGVFTAIWGEFSGLDVKRVDGTQMGYWVGGDNTPENFDTRSLLRDANGRCGAWGDLMQDVLSAQGIASNRVSVTSNDNGVTGLLVKNWVFFQGGIHNQFGPYKWEVNLDVNPINGAEAQKNPDPKSLFVNHCIMEYNGKYYDPSYGQGPFATQADWENGSLDGFYKVFNVNGQNIAIAKKNDPNVIETNFVAIAQ